MIRYECDRCGAYLDADSPHRFIVKIEVYAAAHHIDLDKELEKEGKPGWADLVEQLKRADPDDIEDRTYRRFELDLCDPCRKTFLLNPLNRSSRT